MSAKWRHLLLGFVVAIFALVPLLAWNARPNCDVQIVPGDRETPTPTAVAAQPAPDLLSRLFQRETVPAAAPESKEVPYTTCLTRWSDNLLAVFRATATIVGLLLAVVVGFFVIRRLIRVLFASRSALVFADLTDATGDGDIAKQVAGLSHRAREYLVDELRQIDRIAKAGVRDHGRTIRPDQSRAVQLPERAINKTATDQSQSLINSLTAIATGPTKLVTQFLETITRPQTTIIAGSLHLGALPVKPRLTVEINDATGNRRTLIKTFEVSPRKVTPLSTAPQSTHVPAADAQFLLGKPYHNHGDLAEAKRRYEETLTLHPHHAGGRNALDDLLPKLVPLGNRYDPILADAARWLAIELTELELLERMPIRPKARPHHRSSVLNFVGVCYRVRAGASTSNQDLFRTLALDHFRQAIVEDADWYAPHSNLADMLDTILYHALQSPSPAADRQRSIRDHFNEGLMSYATAISLTAHLEGDNRLLALNDIETRSALLRLRVPERGLRDQAREQIDCVRGRLDWTVNYSGPYRHLRAPHLSTPSRHYANLAAALGHLVTTNPLETADDLEATLLSKRFLAYALGRDIGIRGYIKVDADFASILTEQMLNRLSDELARCNADRIEQGSAPLSDLPDRAFQMAMQPVIEKMKLLSTNQSTDRGSASIATRGG